jgi:hypothetical protein
MEFESYLKIIFTFTIAYTIGEILAYVAFAIIRKTLAKSYYNPDNEETGHKNTPKPSETVDIFRGLIERAFISICLINGIFQGLIVFGTLKVATRLSAPKDNISNSYYLIGNMTSILIAILQYGLYLKLRDIL